MAGLLFFLGLSLAGQFEIGLTLTSRGRGAGAEAGLHGQLLHRRAGGGGGHALHRAVHGSGCRLRAGAVGCCYLCRFYGAGSGAGRAVCGADAATGLDALAARPGVWMEVLRQAVAVPIFATVIWLAWVLMKGYGADLLLDAAGQLSAAGDCRVVPGPLAGKALGNGCCGGDSAGRDRAGRLRPEAGGRHRRGREVRSGFDSPPAAGSHGPPKRSAAIRPRAARSLWTSLQAGA